MLYLRDLPLGDRFEFGDRGFGFFGSGLLFIFQFYEVLYLHFICFYDYSRDSFYEDEQRRLLLLEKNGCYSRYAYFFKNYITVLLCRWHNQIFFNQHYFEPRNYFSRRNYWSSGMLWNHGHFIFTTNRPDCQRNGYWQKYCLCGRLYHLP